MRTSLGSEPYFVLDGIGTARNLIFATWLRSYQTSSLMTKAIPKETFFGEHHKVIERILSRNPTVRLAVIPDDQDVVLGWSVTEPGIVHYVYVKPSFRKYGIARALLDHVERPFIYSHGTYVTRDLEKHLDGCTFNPYEAHR